MITSTMVRLAEVDTLPEVLPTTLSCSCGWQGVDHQAHAQQEAEVTAFRVMLAGGFR